MTVAAPVPPAASPPPAQARPLEGILWMLLTMFLFTTMDSVGKELQQRHEVVQVVWARYFFHVLLLAIVMHRHLPGMMRTKAPVLQITRSALLLVTTLLFYTGLRSLQVAEASSIMFLTPLIVTALAVPLLGEKVGWRRWASILVGFVGALIIVRPGSGALGIAALFVVAGATSNALYHITTRKVSLVDSPWTTLAHTGTVGVVVTSVAAPFYWTAPSAGDWGLFVLMGAIGVTSQFALIRALTVAGASTVAPFSYSTLIWATMWGYLLFGDLPDAQTLTGALIIVASGLYVYHRERVRTGR